MKLPWRTEEEDPYWDFFLNAAPADERNLVATALRTAPEGVVNPVRGDIHAPEVMSGHVKELCRFLGADEVAIARTDQPEHPYAVVCLLEAKHADPRQANGIGGQLPVQRGLFVTFTASAWIRELGYQATTKIDVNNEELAARAGLGILSSEGLLVHPRLGTRVHIAGAILTDLSLQADG